MQMRLKSASNASPLSRKTGGFPAARIRTRPCFDRYHFSSFVLISEAVSSAYRASSRARDQFPSINFSSRSRLRRARYFLHSPPSSYARSGSRRRTRASFNRSRCFCSTDSDALPLSSRSVRSSTMIFPSANASSNRYPASGSCRKSSVSKNTYWK